MIKKLSTVIILLMFINLVFCPLSYAKQLLLECGTKVKLKLVEDVSTVINNEGDTVNFLVSDDVTLGDDVLIKEGQRAVGIISELNQKEKMGKEGSLVIDLDYVKSVDGKKIPLVGTIEKYGENRSILSNSSDVFFGGLVSYTAFLITFPVTFFIKGKDATLPAGYQFRARVEKDVNVSVESL